MMLMVPRGDALLIEIETKKLLPFQAAAYADPSVGVFITIRNPDGIAVVDNQTMTKEDTGKYSYIWQTTTTMEPGVYLFEVKADDATADGLLRIRKVELT